MAVTVWARQVFRNERPPGLVPKAVVVGCVQSIRDSAEDPQSRRPLRAPLYFDITGGGTVIDSLSYGFGAKVVCTALPLARALLCILRMRF